MRTADLFRLAAANLRENPLRTILCALSVAVGTGALLLIASIGLFGQTQVQAALRTIGVSGLTVYLDGRGDAVRIAVAERGGRRVFRIAAAGSIVRYALLVSFAAVPMAGTHFRVAGRKVWNNG